MASVEITKENIETTINDGGIVLLDFWATWCGPCQSFAPVFEAASERHTDIVFGKVDTEAQQELAAMFGITSIPTLVAFRDGIGVFSQAGALPEAALEQLITAITDLDMDEVREKIAQQNSEAAAAADAANADADPATAADASDAGGSNAADRTAGAQPEA